jgi:hypothetical protein
VLLASGLSVIIDAIKESRRIFQRMNSYAIYRIAETLRVLFFMTLAILVFNFYPVTAVMIVMIALLNDGAILSIAYDNVHYKEQARSMEHAPGAEHLHRAGSHRRCRSVWSVLSWRARLPHGPLMTIDSKDYRVPPDKKVDLSKWPTIVDPYSKSKKQYKELLHQHMEKLSSLQQLHYASHRYALLLIFQGMDGAGKDGAIRHVMSGVNPEGCEVFSFKQPSAEELEHDFLWRTTCRLPERGRIGIFNRSYYEEVLVVRVHPEILRSQGLPEELRDEKTSGSRGMAPSRTWRSTFIATARKSSRSFSTCLTRSNESDSLRASMSRTRTGSSAPPTFTRGNTGNTT